MSGYIDWLSNENRNKYKNEILNRFNEANEIKPVKEKKTSDERLNDYYTEVIKEHNEMLDNNITKRIKESKEISESYNAMYGILLTECFMELFNRSIDNSYDQYDGDVARAFISNYIEDKGPRCVLSRMKNTSSMLSEMAFYVEETCKSKDKDCDDESENCCEKEEKKYKIEPEKKSEFFDNLKNTIDIDDVSQTIQLRVSNAMSEFINNNAEKKAEINDTIEQIKEKITPETSEELKEAYQMNANRRIDQINNSGTINLFERLVENLSKSVYTNEDAKRTFCENGKINMNKIIQHVKSVYSVLEIFNTTKLEIFTPDKIQEIVESYCMK